MASISRTIASRVPLRPAKVRSLACLHAVKPPVASSLSQRTYSILSNLGIHESSVPKPTQPVAGGSTPLVQKTETVTKASSSSTENTPRSKSFDDVWDSIIPELRAVAANSRDALMAKGRLNPDEAWKKRSEEINLTMRMAAVGSGGKGLDRPGARFIFGGAAGVTQLGSDPMYQPPSVTSGRTVTGSNFQTAISRLNTILARNKVKSEWRRDRFYTKPFALRYQLRSRRHRKRFSAMVRRKVQIVQAIRRRGM
ncbi:hypothetical protein CPB86DRAFT_553029 [Serendipita vermifera]|nr:hypothetical protein CPB86DRAFT_553029 [Serendipita vermifera]